MKKFFSIIVCALFFLTWQSTLKAAIDFNYQVHVQDIGWMDWKESGDVAGTVGRELRLEAIRIKLTERYARKYDIYYRAHVQDGGWLGWAKNGEPAGTSGASLRMEALQIQLVPKGTHFNRGGRAFYQKENRRPRYI